MSWIIQNNDVLSLTQSSVVSNAVVNIEQADTVSYQLNYSDATPGAQSFVAADVKTNVQTPASSITITSHGYNTGLKVALTGTNLPTGLSATNYWVIVNNANSISLASSLANATAGTKVAITAAGTTSDAALTPAALATTGVVVKLQQSNDGVTYFDVSGLTVTITAAGNTLWLVTAPPTKWHKILSTPATGAINLDVIICERAIVNQ